MLAIRLRRQGRKNHAHYRMIVQDSHWHPTNGKVVAYLGVYDPYKKEAKLDTDSAKKFISNGAQPSPRSAKLLKEAGVKLPKWVEIPKKAKKEAKHPEKLRKNQPKETTQASTEEAPDNPTVPETGATQAEEKIVEEKVEAPAQEAKSEDPPAESGA